KRADRGRKKRCGFAPFFTLKSAKHYTSLECIPNASNLRITRGQPNKRLTVMRLYAMLTAVIHRHKDESIGRYSAGGDERRCRTSDRGAGAWQHCQPHIRAGTRGRADESVWGVTRCRCFSGRHDCP